jgi:hypothetical protein
MCRYACGLDIDYHLVQCMVSVGKHQDAFISMIM